MALLSLWCKDGFRLWDLAAEQEEQPSEAAPKATIEINGEISQMKISPTGKDFALCVGDEFCVYRLVDRCREARKVSLTADIKATNTKAVKSVSFSPKGSYLQATVDNPGGAGEDSYRILVWDVRDSGEEWKPKLVHEAFSAEPKSFHWRDDEKFRVIVIRNLCYVHEGDEFNMASTKEPLYKCSVRPRSTVVFAPARVADANPLLVFFVPAPDDGTEPGIVEFVSLEMSKRASDVPNEEATASASTSATISTPSSRQGGSPSVETVKKAIAKMKEVDGCDLLWSPSGKKVLLATSALVDAMGENYGSVGHLWLTDTEQIMEALEQPDNKAELPLNRIHKRLTQDAQWSPVKDEFVVLEGKAPSDCFVYNADGTMITSLPRGYRNKVVWNPRGDMVAIGGFGNLAGDLSFFYRSEDEATSVVTFPTVAEWRAPCTVLCDWSPSCLYFFTAAVRPRRFIDNQIKIFNRTGQLMYAVDFDALFDVQWIPEDPNSYPFLSPPALLSSGGVNKKSTTYKPRAGGGNQDDDMDMVQKYLSGVIQFEDLPPRLKKSVGARRNPRPSNADKKRQPDLPMDWRAKPDPSVIVNASLQAEQLPPVPASAPQSVAASESEQAQDASSPSPPQAVPLPAPPSQAVSLPLAASQAVPLSAPPAQPASLPVSRAQGPPPMEPVPEPYLDTMANAGPHQPVYQQAPLLPHGMPMGKLPRQAPPQQQPPPLLYRQPDLPKTHAPSLPNFLAQPEAPPYMPVPASQQRLPTLHDKHGMASPPRLQHTRPRSDVPDTGVMQPHPGMMMQGMACPAVSSSTQHPGLGISLQDYSQIHPKPYQQPSIDMPVYFPPRGNMPPANEMSICDAADPASSPSAADKEPVVSLLKQILPSSAKVHIDRSGGSPGRRSGHPVVPAYVPPAVEPQMPTEPRLPPPTEPRLQVERAQLLQLMKKAGMIRAAEEIASSDQYWQSQPQPQQQQLQQQQEGRNSIIATLNRDISEIVKVMQHGSGQQQPQHRPQTYAPQGQVHAPADNRNGNGRSSENKKTSSWASGDSVGWLYVDPKGNVQGPFSSMQMKAWWDRGYFARELLMKREHESQFRPLGERFPDVTKAFVSN